MNFISLANYHLTKLYFVKWFDNGIEYTFMYDRYQPANQMCNDLVKRNYQSVRMVIEFGVNDGTN